jgi:heptosyltransferase-1
MRFLIIKTSALGDLVQTYPAVAALKQLYPDAEIDWVVEKRGSLLVARHPDIAKALEIDSKRWKKRLWHPATFSEFGAFVKLLREPFYDVVFDFQGNCKSALITLLCRAAVKVGFGWKSAPERINCLVTDVHINPPRGQNMRRDLLFFVQTYFKTHLPVSPAEEIMLQEWQAQLTPNTWMICAGSMWANKQLDLVTLQTFLQELHRAFGPKFIFLSGSEEEYAQNQQLQAALPEPGAIAHKLPLPLLQHLMQKVALVIAVDSLPLHLAATSGGTPTFSVFGPTSCVKYQPMGEAHFSFQGSCPYGTSFEKRCPLLRRCATGACIKNIDVHVLFNTFSHWWSISIEARKKAN